MNFICVKAMCWLEEKLEKWYLAYGIIAAAVLLSYCNSFTVPFLLDDFGSIQNNYAIHELFNFAELWKFYANRIFLYFTLSINYAIHDNGVEGYHVTNIIIHILNGILFYLILVKLFSLPYFKEKLVSQFCKSISAISAVMFVCHPIQVNAVTYIVQRTASLAAAFYFLAILFFIKYRVRGRPLSLLLVVLFTVFAMFTKENTITIPFTLLLIEIMFFMKDGKTSLVKRILIFIPIFATLPIIPGTNLLLKGYSQSDPDVAFKASTSMDRFQYFYTELNVILIYIKLMLLPFNQNFDYSNDFPLSPTIWDNYSYVSFLIILMIGVFCVYTIKRNRLVSLGILLFFIGLSVESSFISIKDVYFEHRLYFPTAGFIIFLTGMIMYERKKKPRPCFLLKKPLIIIMAVSLALIPAYMCLTIVRNYTYGDVIRLWNDVAAKAPGSDRAHSALATGYLNAYNEQENNTEYLDLAELEFKKAIDLNYNNSTAHTNLSKVYLLKEEYQKCIDEANKALRIVKSEYAQFNMGSAYLKLGKTKEALEAFLDGYEYNKMSSFILRVLGDTYYDTGDLVNAKKYYIEFLEVNKRFNNKDIERRLEKIEERLT